MSAPTRRQFVTLAGQAALAGALASRHSWGANVPAPSPAGVIVGDAVAAKVGLQVLENGGNAIDAAITAAFVAGIAHPGNCGIGGYGGHAVIGLAGGKKIIALDFNSAAPARARADMFPLEAGGSVVGKVNTFGWLAAGVPGTLAGLELALTRYGTRPLREVLAPAIELCESGRYAGAVKSLDSGPPPKAATSEPETLPRELQRNAALAKTLRTLAARNSAESFYRGDLAATLADSFQRHGGLVTREDLAAYRAREVAPLTLDWNGVTLHTAPLTATGLLLLQAFAALKALDWARLPEPARLHAKIEALRIAWADRQRTWGDPAHVAVPVEQFRSTAYAAECAGKISAALRGRRPVPLEVDPSQAGGTTNLSATDRHGNLIAITLTHGGAYGAQVHVPELGVILGHGMSRFDPRPGRPNSPGPGKRPINNMCPTIITRGGVPVLAAGGAGGTRIPNSLYEVLLNYVGLGATLEAAHAAPRIHTDGTLKLGVEKKHPAAETTLLQEIGYSITQTPAANISAVSFDPATGATQGITNGTT